MFPKNVEENALAILLFNDESALYLSTILKPNYFTTDIYKLIADSALEYVEQYKKAPGIHIADLLVEEIEKYPDLSTTLNNLKKLSSKIHLDFILNEIKTLIKKSSLRTTLTKAVQALQTNDLTEVENILEEGRKINVDLFDPGINFSDYDNVINSLYSEIAPIIKTGIPVLDKYKIGPQAGTLFLLLAASGKGKSWGMVHFAREALYQGKSVLHITLENSRELTLRRYMQSILGMSKDEVSHIKSPILTKGEDLILTDLSVEEQDVQGLKSIEKERLKEKLIRHFNRYAKNLWVQKFPMGYLTFNDLRAYLIGMERSQRFIPDVVVIDYAECMYVDSDNLRIDTGALFKKLHGLAEEMGFALITASQGNRQSFKAKSVRADNAAEDISKIMVSDVVITYSQTDFEDQNNLARLRIEKARDGISGLDFVIAQNYEIGAFCLDSALLGNNYWDLAQSTVED